MARERKYLNEVGISETTMKTNEFEANISLARGCVMMAIFMAIIWVLYLAGVLQNKNLTLINIVFPSSMIVLTIPIIFKRKYLEHKNFKFFILTVYILVITAVNVVIPKHGILLWALTIIVSCHYYSQKVSLFVYAVSSVCMLAAIYLGMLFGEWDPNLMGGMTVIGLEDAFASIIPNNGRALADRLYFIDYLKDHNFDLSTMLVDDDVKAQCTKLYELAEFVDENIKKNQKNVILIGGGIGIPPMLSVLHTIRECQNEVDPCQVTSVIGYRDRHDFLSDNLYEESDNLLIATDDGSRGTHGTVIDALNENHTTGDVIYACGPTPMLRGVKKWGEEQGIPVWLSLEEKMACGIGACLACVCKSGDIDDHSMVKNKRICCDGPVFPAEEVEI